MKGVEREVGKCFSLAILIALLLSGVSRGESVPETFEDKFSRFEAFIKKGSYQVQGKAFKVGKTDVFPNVLEEYSRDLKPKGKKEIDFLREKMISFNDFDRVLAFYLLRDYLFKANNKGFFLPRDVRLLDCLKSVKTKDFKKIHQVFSDALRVTG